MKQKKEKSYKPCDPFRFEAALLRLRKQGLRIAKAKALVVVNVSMRKPLLQAWSGGYGEVLRRHRGMCIV